MKKLFTIVLLGNLLCSCNTKQQEKELYRDVIALHDSVMADNGLLMRNKMQLDTLLTKALPAEIKDSAIFVKSNLTTADDAMNDWMHQFEPDYSGKPHDEAMKYLNDQKTQIKKVDSLTKAAISVSGAFLSKYKK